MKCRSQIARVERALCALSCASCYANTYYLCSDIELVQHTNCYAIPRGFSSNCVGKDPFAALHALAITLAPVVIRRCHGAFITLRAQKDASGCA